MDDRSLDGLLSVLFDDQNEINKIGKVHQDKRAL